MVTQKSLRVLETKERQTDLPWNSFSLPFVKLDFHYSSYKFLFIKKSWLPPVVHETRNTKRQSYRLSFKSVAQSQDERKIIIYLHFILLSTCQATLFPKETSCVPPLYVQLFIVMLWVERQHSCSPKFFLRHTVHTISRSLPKKGKQVQSSIRQLAKKVEKS